MSTTSDSVCISPWPRTSILKKRSVQTDKPTSVSNDLNLSQLHNGSPFRCLSVSLSLIYVPPVVLLTGPLLSFDFSLLSLPVVFHHPSHLPTTVTQLPPPSSLPRGSPNFHHSLLLPARVTQLPNNLNPVTHHTWPLSPPFTSLRPYLLLLLYLPFHQQVGVCTDLM